jgi:glycosyltransferase involved in cell wall biosynthesis
VFHPLLSVVICTHNRVADVAHCLAALTEQAARHRLQIVLVDSASDPDAAVALRALCGRFPDVHVERVEQSGISRARNVGLACATGAWVAFLDDDAIPAPDWVDALLDLLAAAAPTTALFGGRIEALFPAGADAGLITERWKLMLSCVDVDQAGSAADGFNICGANFVVRRSALETIGGFPLGLGRVGGQLIGGEECYVIKRLLGAGHEVLYEPRFAVQHRIHPDRMRRAWIARRAFWEGVTQVAVLDALDEKLPLHLSPVKLVASLPYLWLLQLSNQSDGHIRYQMALGALYAALKRPRSVGKTEALQEAAPSARRA